VQGSYEASGVDRESTSDDCCSEMSGLADLPEALQYAPPSGATPRHKEVNLEAQDAEILAPRAPLKSRESGGIQRAGNSVRRGSPAIRGDSFRD